LTTVDLDTELVVGPFEAENAEQALRRIAMALVERGYALASFADAIVAREKEFPTGLPVEVTGVAIPHCDMEHVIRPAIAVGTLTHPVDFGVMGSVDETVPVDIIIMLAINDPSGQIEVLRRVSEMTLDGDVLTALKAASTKEEVVRVLEPIFKA
jgi:PTS system galactitol-specific IIA component